MIIELKVKEEDKMKVYDFPRCEKGRQDLDEYC